MNSNKWDQHVCVNVINMYPLSPLLFNIVADALGVLLQSAISKGHLSGVLEELIPGGFHMFSMLMIQ